VTGCSCDAWTPKIQARAASSCPIPPKRTKEKPAEGTVIAVGAGKITDSGERMEMTLKVKNRVLFSSYAGSEIKLDGEDYLIMSEDEILAVIN